MIGRKARRAALAVKQEHVRADPDIVAMTGHARVWLENQPSFSGTSRALREAVVFDLCAREQARFEAYQDDAGVPGIRLVDFHSGGPLPLAVLVTAKLRAQFKGV